MILLQLAAILDRLVRDKAFRRQPVLELRAVARRAGAVQETDEMLEERVGAAQSDEHQAVIRRRETVRLLKSFQKSWMACLQFVVCCADGEAALDLAGEFPGGCSGAFADNQKVVGLPAEVLCLEVNLRHDRVDQDRRNAAHEQLGQPVCRDVLLEERARSARGDRTGSASPGQMSTPSIILKKAVSNSARSSINEHRLLAFFGAGSSPLLMIAQPPG